jgi:hypothetical protein
VTRRPVTHMAPRPGWDTTPCCSRDVRTLPINDRIAVDWRRVDCGREEG